MEFGYKQDMDQSHSAQPEPTDTNWQLLGMLEMPHGIKTGTLLTLWLRDTLAPLHLPDDFLARVVESTRQAVVRALQPTPAGQLGQINLFLYALKNRSSMTKSWGFFRIEKIDSLTPQKPVPDQAIEFYLYPEG